MSYTKLLYHVVFSTKYRLKTINETHERDLYAYIMGVINNKKSKLYRIGGTDDHIHILFDMHPSFALSDFIREVKEFSSKWLKQNKDFPYFEGWGEGFAAFTYNLNDKEVVANYIKNQKEHHKGVCFDDEYRQLLNENGIDIDEKYFLKDR